MQPETSADPTVPGEQRRPTGERRPRDERRPRGERRTGGWRARRRVRLAAWSLAGLLALPVLVAAGSWAWVQASIAGDRYSAASVPARPVALVFGAAVMPDHTPSPFLAARLDLARRLWEDGKVRVILVSGDNRARNYDEPTAMRDYLVRTGIPAAAVVRDFAGFNSYASCVRAKQVFGVTGAVLVSQDYHLPRALRICRSVGLDAVGVGSRALADTSAWTDGSRREVLADVKAVWELITRPEPRFAGPPDPAVRVALARAES